MTQDEDDVDLGHAELIRETAMAVLVRLTERKDQELWIPKSCLGDDSEVYGKDDGPDGGEGHCFVKFWWAEKEEL